MPTLSALPAAAKTTRLEIRNATYSVETIDPGFAGVAAVRVIKMVNGEAYDVVRRHDGTVRCDCPSYIFTHEGTAGTCKHGKALLAAGLLVPKPARKPAPAPAPVTRADLKRASYFGLRLPSDAPRAVEPVAWVVTPAPVDLGTFAVVVSGSPEVITARTTALRPADAREVASWLDHMAMLADAPTEDGSDEWEAWHDEIFIELGPEAEPIVAVEEAPRTSARRRPFVPTRADEMYDLGFALALDGERMAQAPAGSSGLDRADFRLGQVDGLLALVRRELDEAKRRREERAAEDAAVEAWVEERDREEALAEMFEGPESAWADAELVEVRGRRSA